MAALGRLRSWVPPALGLRRVAARLAAGRADEDPPEPESVLEEMERTMQRQARAARLRKLGREMEPRGAPERTLTRQAMEQIRYLNLEFPEEWPVSRLAQGFQVEPDIIRRVLRSRFSPSLERSMKQDSRVLAKQSSGRGLLTDRGPQQQALLTRESTFKLLPASPRRGVLPQHAAPSGSPVGHGAPQPERGSQEEEEEEEEEWGGELLSEEELEALAAEGREANLPVVQRGREFFDEDGRLLYRVPAAPQPD